MKIVTDYPVKHFKSSNHIDMVEGSKFNWSYYKVNDYMDEIYHLSIDEEVLGII